jgi:hypothetical protein
MNRGHSLLVLGVIVLVAVAAVWLLSGAGNSGGSTTDPKGDVDVTKGSKPPSDFKLADLTEGSIVLEDDSAVFEATVDQNVPDALAGEAIAFRWEITENGQVTWIVSASVDVERTASVVATQVDYRSSTIDDSLPGDLVVEGGTVTVTLETDGLEGFPSAFDWTLQTELDGDRTRSPSAVATDSVPNEGSLRVGS